MGPEAGDGARAEQLLRQQVQRALQIGHGDALVDDHPLHLMEHGGVGGVHLVLAVHPAGGDDTDGQLHGVHGPHLHGGGLGAEHHPAVLVEIEGVRPVPGGVPLTGVEPVEIQLGQLHLRPVQHGEAHADEHFLDLVQRGVHGVAAAHLHGLAGNGHVHRLRLQPQLHSGRLHLFRGALKGALQGGAHLVGQLPHGGALLGGQAAHLLEQAGELPLLAQVLHPQLVQSGCVLDVLESGERLGADLC